MSVSCAVSSASDEGIRLGNCLANDRSKNGAENQQRGTCQFRQIRIDGRECDYFWIQEPKRSGTESVLTDSGILWFPVMVSDEFKTKLELVRKRDQWMPGEFGNVRSAQEVWAVSVKLKDLLRSKGIGDTHTTSLVQVPVLLATFLYVQSPEGEFLIPAMVNPERYKIENGVVYPAEEVLTALKELAAEIKEGTIR